MSGVDSWVRNSEVGVVGRNVTQNRSKKRPDLKPHWVDLD